MARVRAVLRRHRHDPNAMPTHGLVVDDSACRASVAGRDLDLTQVEFQLGTLSLCIA
ncbi:two-component system regulatory protein [Xanthomonas fragariae]|uniref:Two-component system regulatory protein n=1 Tax=Xanthomonas fragariae TaxID=48664 RepID=A0A1Y6HT86_9XANT|nr:hypothetical protein PD885_00603 [Xanthomonas fragariae]SMR04663.1 two-component system regulatory protein [Xanthomonas fragariae]